MEKVKIKMEMGVKMGKSGSGVENGKIGSENVKKYYFTKIY